MANKKYTPEQITEMNFQVVPDGYRCEEVDAFLDELNEQVADQLDQIQTLNETLEAKTRELTRLKDENEKIRDEINKMQIQDNNDVSHTFSTKQVLKRLAEMEKSISDLTEAVNKKK